MIEVMVGERIIAIQQGDITTQSVDAIVNAANSGLMGGGGVDGAIHRAGGPSIMQECREIISQRGPLPAGQAVSTTAGNLHASYVIHTVGPIWHGGTRGEDRLLTSAYLQSLLVAEQLNLASVAFPSISTGAYGYPVEQAAPVAIDTVRSFLLTDAISIARVIFVLFNTATFQSFSRAASV